MKIIVNMSKITINVVVDVSLAFGIFLTIEKIAKSANRIMKKNLIALIAIIAISNAPIIANIVIMNTQQHHL